MSRHRTPAEEQVAELLRTARESLNLSTAFLTRLDGRTQHLEVVETSVPLLFPEKFKMPQAASLCQAALDGRVPQVMADLTDFPEAMKLPPAWIPRIRSFLTVPVRLTDGTLYGTFCAAGLSRDNDLSERDKALMTVLARAAALVIEPTVVEEARRQEILDRLRPVLREGGPTIVFQPIVALATGERVGAEALSRFPAAWGKAPDVVFAEAHGVGLGERLELQAVTRVLKGVAPVGGYLSVNLSPGVLLSDRARRVLGTAPLDRLVLELSEHEAVADYPALRRVLDPLRAEGLRLAIDDVGAGFSSLRHIIVTAPDVIKLDRSLVAGVGHDEVLATLAHSLVDVAAGLGAVVVAEGIEEPADAERLGDLGVGYGQGWLFGRPGQAADLRPVAPRVPEPRGATGSAAAGRAAAGTP